MVIEGEVSDKGGRIKKKALPCSWGNDHWDPREKLQVRGGCGWKLGIGVPVCAPGPSPNWTHCQLDGRVSA